MTESVWLKLDLEAYGTGRRWDVRHICYSPALNSDPGLEQLWKAERIQIAAKYSKVDMISTINGIPSCARTLLWGKESHWTSAWPGCPWKHTECWLIMLQCAFLSVRPLLQCSSVWTRVDAGRLERSPPLCCLSHTSPEIPGCKWDGVLRYLRGLLRTEKVIGCTSGRQT